MHHNSTLRWREDKRLQDRSTDSKLSYEHAGIEDERDRSQWLEENEDTIEKQRILIAFQAPGIWTREIFRLSRLPNSVHYQCLLAYSLIIKHDVV
jgi:hypothetical protein